MKTSVECLKKQKKELVYPILARAIKEKYVCLFSAETICTVIVDGYVGEHYTKATPVTNSSVWEILPSDCKVILQND